MEMQEDGTNLVQIDPSVPSWNFLLGVKVLEVPVPEAEESDRRKIESVRERDGWMSDQRRKVKGAEEPAESPFPLTRLSLQRFHSLRRRGTTSDG